MTQADVDALTTQVEANTATLANIQTEVVALQAQIASNPGAPASSLDLSKLTAAVGAQTTAVTADAAADIPAPAPAPAPALAAAEPTPIADAAAAAVATPTDVPAATVPDAAPALVPANPDNPAATA